MHVKQLITSEAFQMIPRKAIFVSRRKTALWKSRRSGQSAHLENLRSQDSNLHIPQIYCNTLLSTNSTHSWRGVGVSWSHVHPLNRTLRQWVTRIIAMCFQMMCWDERRDYNTQYSEESPRCWKILFSQVSSYPDDDALSTQFQTLVV